MHKIARSQMACEVKHLIELITAGQVVVVDSTDYISNEKFVPVVLDAPEHNVRISVDCYDGDDLYNKHTKLYTIEVLELQARLYAAPLSGAVLQPPAVDQQFLRTTESTFSPVLVMLLNKLFNNV